MINAELVVAYAYWEALGHWVQIFDTNTWPPDTAITTNWKVENTGDESAVFRTRLLGVESVEAQLTPGATFSFELPAISLSPGTHQLTLEIIINDEAVVSCPFEVVTSTVPVDFITIILPILTLGLMAGLLLPMVKGTFKK